MRLLLLIGLTLPAAAAPPARDVTLLLGGGGDPRGRYTSFDFTMKTLPRRLSAGGYEAIVAFDGEHVGTRGMVSRAFPENSSTFTPANARALMRDLEVEVRAGRVKKLFIIVNSHGSRGPARVHLIATADPRAPTFDLDELRRLKRAAKRRGIPLAIADFSCYSGQTLRLADAGTCVITGAPDDTPAFADFAERFMADLAPGRSLEDTVLSARAASRYAWPQISTAAGRAAERALREFTSGVSRDLPLLHAYDAGTPDAVRCARDEAAQMRGLFAVATQARGLDPELTTRYRRVAQSYYVERRRALGRRDDARKPVRVDGDLVVRPEELADLDGFLKTQRLLVDSDEPHERDAARRYLAAEETLREARERAADRSDEARVAALADELTRLERDLYQRAYARAPLGGLPKGDPCRDFRF